MVVRILDIGFDPIIGGIMDRTKTRMGRYRPWLIVDTPLVMLGMGALFMAQPGVGPVYLTAWLLVAYAGWSVLGLAQLSLAANISPDYNERSKIYGWWQAAFLVGMILSMFLPKILAMLGYTSAFQSMSGMAWLVIILMPITVGICLLGVQERVTNDRKHNSGLREYFGLLKSKTVRQVLLAEGSLGIATGSSAVLAIFFFLSVKHINRADVGLIYVIQFTLSLATTPFWSWMAGNIGKHRTLSCSALFFAISQAGYYFVPDGSFIGTGLVACGTGIGYSAINLLPRSMLADVADQERLNCGVERTGLLFALLTGVWKIGQAVSVGAMLFIAAKIGFSAAAGANNPPEALQGLTYLYVGIPVLLNIIGAIVIYNYPLTAARHAEIRRELEARGEG
jgi:Na+/melibiose symporter-like transporter